MLHCDLDELFMFFHIYSRGFARRTNDDDGIRSFGDMEIDQCTKRHQVETSVFVHGSDDRNEATCNHDVSYVFWSAHSNRFDRLFVRKRVSYEIIQAL